MMGADLIGARIRQALGEDAQLDRGLFRRAGILEFLLLPPGRIRSITGLTQARRIPGVVEVQYNVRKGDTVGVIQSGDDRTGHLLAVADTREAVLGAVEEVKRTLRVAME
jgi:biotin carboxylase